jgi:hypothetical protein
VIENTLVAITHLLTRGNPDKYAFGLPNYLAVGSFKSLCPFFGITWDLSRPRRARRVGITATVCREGRGKAEKGRFWWHKSKYFIIVTLARFGSWRRSNFEQFTARIAIDQSVIVLFCEKVDFVTEKSVLAYIGKDYVSRDITVSSYIVDQRPLGQVAPQMACLCNFQH